MSVQPVVADVLDALEKAGVGSVFEKAPHGWNVKWVDGGTVIHVQGATITAALGSHGAQVVRVHDVPEVQPEVQAEEVADPEPVAIVAPESVAAEPVTEAPEVVPEVVPDVVPDVVEVVKVITERPKGKKARKRKGAS